MTVQPINPLLRATAPREAISVQAFVDQRNAALGPEYEREWYVSGAITGKAEGSARMRWKDERLNLSGGYCQPHEAAEIMRRYGLGGAR